MSPALSAALIAGITVLVALLDFGTSAEFVGSILFTLPLALCATQGSKRLLWGTTTAVAFLTVAAEFWGFHRAATSNLWIGLANRVLLVASLFTLATFIHFWIENNQKIALDAAEQKQAESNLRSLGERLSLAANIAKVGVWDWDLASNALIWDATMFEIYGFAPIVPIPYEKWSATVFPEDLPAAEASLRRLIHERDQGSAEFRITLADGTVRYVAAAGKAVLDEQGNVARAIGVNMDITARKLAETRCGNDRLRLPGGPDRDVSQRPAGDNRDVERIGRGRGRNPAGTAGNYEAPGGLAGQCRSSKWAACITRVSDSAGSHGHEAVGCLRFGRPPPCQQNAKHERPLKHAPDFSAG